MSVDCTSAEEGKGDGTRASHAGIVGGVVLALSPGAVRMLFPGSSVPVNPDS